LGTPQNTGTLTLNVVHIQITVFPGDVILFPAGEKHWHGATSDSEFSHIFVAVIGYETAQIEE